MASFHFGTWEMLPRICARKGLPVTVVAGRQRDGTLASQLGRLRTWPGVTMAGSLRDALSATAAPGVTGFMLDNTSRGSHVEVEADGLMVRIPTAAFELARRRGDGVAATFCRLDGDRLQVTVYPAGDERAVVQNLLEQVRQHPEEWVFWAKAGAFRPAEAA
jgi:lauroyl/myristoyl acyltransferase